MTATLLHRVRRQTWRLRVGSPPAAFAARARFRAEVEDLLPAFGRAFDAWAPGDAVLRIPRLEMSLRVRSLDELRDALDDALARALAREPRPAAPAPERAAADALQSLLHYLETGALEWYAAHAEPAAAAAALRAVLLAQLPAAVRAAPVPSVPPGAALRWFLRLLQLLPVEHWIEAAGLLQPATTPRPIGADGVESSVRALRSPAGDASIAAAIRAILSERARLGDPGARALAAAVLAAARGHAVTLARRADALARVAGLPIATEAPAAVARFLAATRAAHAPYARATRPTVAAPAEPRSPPAAAETPGARPFIAENSGLVLLHPFLPRLLEACALWTTKHGIAPAALPRAAALLHWLARGRDEVHEFELGAVKVLLGLRPDDPLPVGAGLVGAREREEGEALLAAAIAHWRALEGTSIAGLRVAFLQRRAALREEEDGWRLQPERESFDVLLDRLPWTLSTVKLPWMTRPLYTDWPTR